MHIFLRIDDNKCIAIVQIITLSSADTTVSVGIRTVLSQHTSGLDTLVGNFNWDIKLRMNKKLSDNSLGCWVGKGYTPVSLTFFLLEL